MTRIMKSSDDASVNFVTSCSDGGFFESRFVQRTPDYFIVYLSSHSGCNKSCRFCHLTATGQTTMTPATLDDYVAQAKLVLEHYRAYVQLPISQQTERTVHFNFMARGEPLSNPTMQHHAQQVYDELASLADAYGLDSKFKISSIIPADFTGNLEDVLTDKRAMLYYSLYSLDPQFRQKWIGKAMDPSLALPLIKSYQASTGNPITIHWALIAGQNDSEEVAADIVSAVTYHGIAAKFNLVRYNPHDARHGVESSEETILARFTQISNGLATIAPNLVSRIVPRVGYDVKASCGMFIS